MTFNNTRYRRFLFSSVVFVLLNLLIFKGRINAQAGSVYRFLVSTRGFVYILNCEGNICSQESTVVEKMDLRALSLSSDGDKLAGVWFKEDMSLSVIMVHMDGSLFSEHRLVDYPDRPTTSAWSPDENWLLLSSMFGRDCFIALGNLSEEEEARCQSWGDETAVKPDILSPRWSRDGHYLLFGGKSVFYSPVFAFSRNDIFVMDMEHILEYQRAASLSVTSSLLGNCAMFDWISDDEVFYRCQDFPDPVDNPEPMPLLWYVTNIETGEIRRADVPAALIESECMSAFPGTSKIAFNDGDSTLSVWDMASGNVEQFTIPAELKDMHCRVEWIPE